MEERERANEEEGVVLDFREMNNAGNRLVSTLSQITAYVSSSNLAVLNYDVSGSGRGEPRSNAAVRSGAPQKVLPIETPAFSLDELNRLTGNFGSKALIGEGSYGRVFFATLIDGQQAAIKKLDTSSSPDPEDDFASQLSVVSRLKHEHFCGVDGLLLGGK
ncbi:hypothetical protein RHGRI_010415 [Rhododendron griersonianum]|uniref:Protein kinase domain-containing protein n=1 Tax=Rhododendron griersonianum TaxID=479676 RepID=A0AAV6KIG1_9ERIC|nr:hypothetical protein RHGRI_010415 [Rhododendron griersonianum]